MKQLSLLFPNFAEKLENRTMKYYAPKQAVNCLTITTAPGKLEAGDILDSIVRMILMDSGLEAEEAMMQAKSIRPLSHLDGQSLLLYNSDMFWQYMKSIGILTYHEQRLEEISEEEAMTVMRQYDLRTFKAKELSKVNSET